MLSQEMICCCCEGSSENLPTLWLLVNVQVMEVIGFLFQYLKMLRAAGPQEWVFQEQKAISKLNFEYFEDPSPDEYAISLASMSFPLSCLNNKHMIFHLSSNYYPVRNS
jgi:secreted Zn-dependent insulinase-like peptidase